jgi:hypothetical protein
LIYTIIVQNVMLLPQSAHLVHFMSIIRSTNRAINGVLT